MTPAEDNPFRRARHAALALPLVLLGLCAPLSALRAQPTTAPLSTLNPQLSTNRVLELDGTNSYVELPSNIFTNLTEATVEGWVRWSRFGSNSRFFDFGKGGQMMTVFNAVTNRNLAFSIPRNDYAKRNRIDAADVLWPNEWVHVAAVSGPAGMKLYVNGVLAGAHPSTLSFAAIGNGRNYLGYHNTHDFRGGTFNDVPFRGQMDEVRVWRVARTLDQVREAMHRRLTGQETDLVGLWNFDIQLNRAAMPPRERIMANWWATPPPFQCRCQPRRRLPSCTAS